MRWLPLRWRKKPLPMFILGSPAEKHEVSSANGKALLVPTRIPTPQVLIYLPDNGRDPDLVKPIPDPRRDRDFVKPISNARVKDNSTDQDPARKLMDPATVPQ